MCGLLPEDKPTLTVENSGRVLFHCVFCMSSLSRGDTRKQPVLLVAVTAVNIDVDRLSSDDKPTVG